MKAKKKFAVYAVTSYDYAGLGINSAEKQLLGTTYAASAERAIANVRFRLGLPGDDCGAMWADGCWERYLVAEELEDQNV